MDKSYIYEEDRNILYIDQVENHLNLKKIVNENVLENKQRTLFIKINLDPLLSHVEINLDELKILNLSVEQSLGKLFISNHTIDVKLYGDYNLSNLSINIKCGLKININLDRIPRKIHFHDTASVIRLSMNDNFALDNYHNNSYIIAHKLIGLYLNYYASHIYVKCPVYSSFYYPDDKPIHSSESNVMKAYNKSIAFNDKCVVYDYNKISNLFTNKHHPLKNILKNIIAYLL